MKPMMLILLSGLLLACQTQANQHKLRIEQVYQSNQCPIYEPRLHTINSLAEAKKVLGQSIASQLASKLTSGDLQTKSLVLIAVGQKPSAGYGIEFGSEYATLSADTLYLDLNFIQPPAGAMVATVMTSPCAVIAVKRLSWDLVVAEKLDL